MHTLWNKRKRTPYMGTMPSVCLYFCDHISGTELFLSDCLEIQHRSSLQKLVRQVRVSWQSAQWHLYHTWGSKSISAHTFHFSWLILVEFDLDDTCVTPLSSGEFCENQHSESHTLFRGMNEYMSVLSTFMYDLGGMQCNRTACNYVKHLW